MKHLRVTRGDPPSFTKQWKDRLPFVRLGKPVDNLQASNGEDGADVGGGRVVAQHALAQLGQRRGGEGLGVRPFVRSRSIGVKSR